MARRKKKQKPLEKQPEAQIKKPVQQGVPGLEIKKPVQEAQPGPEIKFSSETKTAKKSKGVAVSTCIAGMFLTLVLGLYLGTLMPGITGDIINRETPPAPQPAAKAQAPEPETELASLVAELEKKAAANPDSAPDWINLGNIYFDASQPGKAISAYEHALRLAPKNANVLTDLGIMYRETGNYEKALECFRKAVAINPRHENAMFNEGVVLALDLNKKTEAEAAWRRLLEINPQAHGPNGAPVADMIRQLQ